MGRRERLVAMARPLLPRSPELDAAARARSIGRPDAVAALAGLVEELAGTGGRN